VIDLPGHGRAPSIPIRAILRGAADTEGGIAGQGCRARCSRRRSRNCLVAQLVHFLASYAGRMPIRFATLADSLPGMEMTKR
jgi:hypothetical protein